MEDIEKKKDEKDEYIGKMITVTATDTTHEVSGSSMGYFMVKQNNRA